MSDREQTITITLSVERAEPPRSRWPSPEHFEDLKNFGSPVPMSGEQEPSDG